MFAQGIHIKVGDIVRAGHAEDLVIVRGCFARRGCFYLIVDSFSKRRELSPRAWECTVRGPLSLLDVATTTVHHASCWAWGVDGRILALV